MTVTFVHACDEGGGGYLQTFVLLLYIEAATYILPAYYIMFVKVFTETIQVTVGHKYFPQGPHVGQHCSRVYMYYIYSMYNFLYSTHAILHNILINFKCSKNVKDTSTIFCMVCSDKTW